MKFVFGIILTITLVFMGYLVFQLLSSDSIETTLPSKNNVTLENGKQIIEISAKAGYQPRESVVKPGIPTVLRFNTKGTFDCSAQVIIPSLKISQALPPSGITDVDLGTLEEGVLLGSCGMGMYPFQINIQS